MKKETKTVLFGPFVGEFGWELLYWHGWVKRLCKRRYKNYRKIACSYSGRYPFYPYVDEFWPLPEKFLKNKISARGYITDNWIKGFPKPAKKTSELPEVKPLIDEVIETFKKKLPKNTEFVIPWEMKYDEEDKRHYGVEIPGKPKSDADFVTHFVPFSNQILERLRPTPEGKKILEKLVGPQDKLIAIFPRHRPFRRPDKDWTNNKYERLIELLQKNFPEFKIAILGEPGGTFFAEDGVPKGCIDLIAVDPKSRMDVQLTALEKSVLAVGSQSGGTAFSLAAGCKTFTWGGVLGEKGFSGQNYLKTKLVFYPATNPTVDLIFDYTKWMLGAGKRPYKHEIKRVILVRFLNYMPRFMRKSRAFVAIKKLLKFEF